MYFQEDTVMRMIEMLGAAFGKIFRLLDDLDAEEELDEAYRRFCGLDRSTAEGLSVEVLIDMLTEERRLALCELLATEVQRFQHRLDTDQIQQKLHRALQLLVSIDDDTVAKLRVERARQLFDRCAEQVPADETASILRFLCAGGAYADAEDILFTQTEAFGLPDDQAAVYAAGRDFYAALKRLPDDRLAAGNLPREEVAQGETALDDWARNRSKENQA